MLRHRVTAGHVTVETAVPCGRALIDIARGELVPLDVLQEQIDHELNLGQIEPVEVDESEPSNEDDDEGDEQSSESLVVPEKMSVPTTLEWVGVDLAKAKAALAAETAQTGQDRKTLIARLEEIVAAAEAAATEAAEREGAGTDENSGASPPLDS